MLHRQQTNDVKWYVASVFSNDAPVDPDIQNLLDALLEPPGFGTKCMNMETDVDA